MATYNLITDFIKLNEFRFYPEDKPLNPLYNTRDFDNGSLSESALSWQLNRQFWHKKIFIDTCTVYTRTQANFEGFTLPYPDLVVLDCNKNEIATLSISPFIQGAQQIDGDMIYNPNTNTYVQCNNYCWQFRFQDVVSESGVYYLRHTNTAEDGITTVSHISEAILVYGQTASVFPETVLIECYNNSNNNYAGYLYGGWDNPDFHPVFRHRIEAYLAEFDPKSIYIGFIQQQYEQEKILAENYRSFTLFLGGMSANVAAFSHEKINEGLSCDVFKIDGKRYKRDILDTDAGIKSLWEGQKPHTTDRRWISCKIREENNDQHIFFDVVTNPCVCPTLTDVVVTKVGVTYYMHFSFDMSGGFQCPFFIQVTTAFTTGFLYLNSLADFSSSVGDIYTKSSIIGGYPDISYVIKTQTGVICNTGTATYEECAGPVFTTPYISFIEGVWNIVIPYTNCGTDCHTINWTYLQGLPPSGTPDSGSVMHTVSCPSETKYIPIDPQDYTEGDDIKYSLTFTDCCGRSGSAIAEYTPTCTANPPTILDVLKGGTTSAVLYLVYGNISDSCTTGYQYSIQRTAPTVGVPQTGTFSVISPRVYITTPQAHGLTSGGVTYNVTVTDCCGNETNAEITIDIDCDSFMALANGEVVKIGDDYFFNFDVTDCGAGCGELVEVALIQNNSYNSGVGDFSIPTTISVDCMALPYAISIPITPNLDIVGTTVRYQLKAVGCCRELLSIDGTYEIP